MQQKNRSKTNPPQQPWQTGHYSRRLSVNILLPYSFLLLCRLWEVRPIDIIKDFLDNLAHSSWKREGRDAAKEKLVHYILQSGYGKSFYSEGDILQMFKELDALGLLFPSNGEDKTLDSYVAFRENFYEHWFNQWYYKTRRKEL